MAKRLRWWIADQLNRLPGQCWADLVTWALGWEHESRPPRWPWRPVTAVCRRDVADTGVCYCGKLCDPVTALEAAQRRASDG